MTDSSSAMLDLDAIAAAKQAKRDAKKNRKPYTITKPRESWTDEEHDLFLEALQLFEREWKQIEAHIKTKTVIQIRSHAQKYFLKMQKTGKQECIPPPRPKRRSKKPYPKLSRDRKTKMGDFHMTHGNPMSQDYIASTYPFGAPSTGHNGALPPRSMMQPQAVGNSLQWALWERQQLAELQQEQLSQAQYYLQQAIAAHTTDDKKSESSDASKAPNFQKIYSFLGSLFDPSTTGHVDQLRCMDEMDRHVVQLLMQNLASNLGKHHSIVNDFHAPPVDTSNKADAYNAMPNSMINKLVQPSSLSRPGAMSTGSMQSASRQSPAYPGASAQSMM